MKTAFSMTRIEWRRLLNKILPKATPPPRKPAGKRKPRQFRFTIDGETHWATALTRSEARGEIKRRLKIDRLPVGA